MVVGVFGGLGGYAAWGGLIMWRGRLKEALCIGCPCYFSFSVDGMHNVNKTTLSPSNTKCIQL